MGTAQSPRKFDRLNVELANFAPERRSRQKAHLRGSWNVDTEDAEEFFNFVGGSWGQV
jgi:hypothetical protein